MERIPSAVFRGPQIQWPGGEGEPFVLVLFGGADVLVPRIKEFLFWLRQFLGFHKNEE